MTNNLPTRRTVIRATAWAVPVIAVAAAAPAAAASFDGPPAPGGVPSGSWTTPAYAGAVGTSRYSFINEGQTGFDPGEVSVTFTSASTFRLVASAGWSIAGATATYTGGLEPDMEDGGPTTPLTVELDRNAAVTSQTITATAWQNSVTATFRFPA
jgi:hypothetical protein